MNTSVIGYPRIGKDRELKFASEKYFRNEIGESELLNVAKEIRKGELFDIEITEIQIDGKADRNKPFTISLIFNITDTDGQIRNVEGTYVRDMMLGASLNDLEIRYDETNGYYLFEDV